MSEESSESGFVLFRHTRRAARLVIGLALLGVGAFLALPGIPGPGLLVAFFGLSVLSVEFHWARRLRDGLRNAVERVRRRAHGG